MQTNHINPGLVNKSGNFTFIEKFLISRTGTDPEVLAQFPTEKARYVCMGTAITLTTVLAFLAALYGMYSVFENFLVVYGALLWAAVVYNLDKTIISGWHKISKGFWRKTGMIIGRLIIAITISLIISAPLESAIFHREIALFHKQETEKMCKSLTQTNAPIDEAEKKIQQLKDDTKLKQQQRDAAYEAHIKEAEGTAGTHIEGIGPVYKQKREEYLKQNRELEELKAKNQTLIEKYQQEVDSERQKIGDTNNTIINAQEETTGLPTQLRILSAISQTDRATWLTNLAITILFVLIEVAPILTKLLTGTGAYEHFLEQIELIQIEKNNEFKRLAKESIELMAHHPSMDKVQEQIVEQLVNDWQYNNGLHFNPKTTTSAHWQAHPSYKAIFGNSTLTFTTI